MGSCDIHHKTPLKISIDEFEYYNQDQLLPPVDNELNDVYSTLHCASNAIHSKTKRSDNMEAEWIAPGLS